MPDLNINKLILVGIQIFLLACSGCTVNKSSLVTDTVNTSTLPKIKEGMVLHFGYGSNLNESFMRKHCPGLEYYTNAKLYNYKIYFPYYSKNYQGGLSGILEEPGEVVHGVVYQIPQEEILKLDILEGVPDNEYKRETFLVEAYNGEKIRADIYRVVEPQGPFTPSPKYLDIMIAGAKQHDFDPEYIQRFIDLKADAEIKLKKGNIKIK